MEVRADIRRLAAAYPGTTVSFPADPFPPWSARSPTPAGSPAICAARPGRDAVVGLHAAFPPFSGEDFALYLDRVPGTYTFLGVRAPGAPVTTAYPHFPDFAPDERAIGLGVRTMAGRLAERASAA